ncbi:MAG: calcium-binding protein [Dolichospermum sp. DET50]|nr:calcium-binding protein [Dolichospermum sp. DET66]MBS3034754.1 calcium-binding protein [Dolichospermum sp. DET67]MBS3039957.1 calcium-binding protein [Dolichospermum sp. DET50]QSX70757.1 MAG: calcium-binding protein [Dolichospermum sp. DET69]
MIGGAGNDSYYVDNSGDIITENLNEGTDKVFSPVNYTLSSNLENLTLQGTSAINGTGNALNNLIIGNTADNILIGGAGTDTIIGGAGNDSYYVDNSGDIITENLNEGTDKVFSPVNYTLSSNLENLTLQGTSAINGTGNALNNLIIGNTADNILIGGAGTDTMIGGGGNDSYYVDNSGDIITENLNEGTDKVFSPVNYTLSSNLENLTLQGTSAINGTGNALNNLIIGNTADNILIGGAGTDTMIGGAGNDSYYVDNSGDIITENLNEGTDKVFSPVNYTLSSNLENLTLQGTSAINGTGNALNNLIIGNTAANILTGGVGNDTIYLGLNDGSVDIVNYALNVNDGSDLVYQFVRGVGGDKIQFTGVANIDVVTSGANTMLRIGDGIMSNTGFGTGQLLVTLSGITGFTATDINVNLFGSVGTNFLFS